MLAGDPAEILIHVVRVDRVPVAFVIEVLKQLIAGHLFAALDDLGQALVLQIDCVVNAALALEVEGDLGAVDLHMLVAHCG